MKSILSLALVALMLPAPLLAQQSLKRTTASDTGGADPGGGGLVRQGDHVKTMAEAGLVLERSKKLIPSSAPEYYFVSEETKEALREVIEKLPLLQMGPTFYELVLGHRGSYYKLSSVNKEVFGKIRDDYAHLVRKQGKHLDEANFVLPAFSTDGTTYIVADIFDKELTSQQRALILIHEYFMRSATEIPMQQRLAKVLQVDALIFKTIKSEDLHEPTVMGLLQAIQELRTVGSANLRGIVIAQKLMFLQARDEAVLVSDLVTRAIYFGTFPRDSYYFGSEDRVEVDPSMVKTRLEARSSGIEELLRGVTLEAGGSVDVFREVDLHYKQNVTPEDYARNKEDYMKRLAFTKSLEDHCAIHAKTLKNSDVPLDRLLFADPRGRILAIECPVYSYDVVEMSGL